MNRRNFIEQTCLSCIAAGAGLSLLSLASCSTTQQITVVPENNIIKINVDAFKENSTSLLLRVNQLEHSILVLKTKANFKAIYMQCTHQNNPVIYTAGGIVCNAHGSQFDMDGEVKIGPADKRLKKYKITEENNILIINLNTNEN